MDGDGESKVTNLLKRMTLAERVRFMVKYAKLSYARNRASTDRRKERDRMNAKHRNQQRKKR